MNQTLAAIEENIRATTVVANTSLDDIHPNTRGAWGTKIAEARDALPGLRAQYRTALFRNAVAIFVVGSAQKTAELSKVILEEGEGLVGDADSLYNRIAKDVEPTLSPARTWGISQTQRMQAAIMEVMAELNLTNVPMPAREENVVVPTLADLTAYIKKSIRGGMGDGLAQLYLQKQVADKALSIRYNQATAPVLVMNADDGFRASVAKDQDFGRGSHTVTLADDGVIDKETLTKIFKETTKAIRNKKNS